MPITSTYAPISYAGNGVTGAFTIPFPYQFDTDIAATKTVVATGVTTPLVMGTDYAVSPITNSPADIGTLSLIGGGPALPTGVTLNIARAVPVTQDTSWVPNDPNPSTATMNAVDKLTMIVQDNLVNPLDPGGDRSTFVRGDGSLSNTLVGMLGAFAVPADTQTVMAAGQAGAAAIKVISGASAVGSFRFAEDGSADAWGMQWAYDPDLDVIAWQGFGTAFLGTFGLDGNVAFDGNLDVTGTTHSALFTGAADASLIATGTLDTARLGSGAASSNTFLRGDRTWAVVSGGGGGINTTTTGTFTIAAVDSTQTVPVTATTGIVVGTDLQVSDGTHLIIGLVTAIASLNLTVKTQAIALGSAGNTMASGAAVQSSSAPGSNTIQVSDAAISPATMSTLKFTGTAAADTASGNHVPLAITSLSGGTATARAYIPAGSLFPTIFSLPVAAPGVVGYSTGSDSSSNIIPVTGSSQVLIQHLGGSLAFGQLEIGSFADGVITPVKLNVTNSLTDQYLFGYDSGTGHFKMFPNGVPGGGTAAGFLRGDGTWNNAIGGGQFVVATDTPPILNTQGTVILSPAGSLQSGGITPSTFDGTSTWTPITTPPWFISTAPIACANATYPISAIDGVHGQTESAFGMNVRCARSIRGNMGFWAKERSVENPSGTITINPATGPYVVFSTILSNFTIALADTTDVPTVAGIGYAGEVTLEFQSCAHTITWPGTITWVDGGSAPVPAAAGTTIIKLIRAQDDGVDVARWIGFRAVSSATSYTDGQARSAVFNSAQFVDSTTIDFTVTPGSSGSVTGVVKAGSVTNAMLAGAIQPTKLQLPGGTTTFLRGDGAFATPPGGALTLPYYNVVSYGADPTGVSDSTVGLNAAYSAAAVAGGGTVILPPGVYNVSATLNWGALSTGGSGSSVNIEGAGCMDAFGNDVAPSGNAAATTLLWTGGASTVIHASKPMSGIQWSGFHVDCAGSATIGIEINAANNCEFGRLSVVNQSTTATSIGIKLNNTGVAATGHQTGSFADNLFHNLVVAAGYTNANGTAIWLGTSVSSSGLYDITLCTFIDCVVGHGNIGYFVGFSDANRFIGCRSFHTWPTNYRSTNAHDNNYDFVLDCQHDVDTAGFSGDNVFLNPIGSFKVNDYSTGNVGAGPQATIINYDCSNSGYPPYVVSTTATNDAWVHWTGNNPLWNGSQNAVPGLPHMNTFDFVTSGPGTVTTEAVYGGGGGSQPSAPGYVNGTGVDIRYSGSPGNMFIDAAISGVGPLTPGRITAAGTGASHPLYLS